MGRTIAVLSPGEMGSQVGRLLHEAGNRVVSLLEGRSEGTRRRAAEAGFESLSSMDDVAREADLAICVVPSLSALPTARAVADAMRRTGSRLTYLDLNSIGPQTAREIGRTVEEAGGRYVDGSIIGTADHLTTAATVYLAGGAAEEVATWIDPPLETSVLGTEPDQASGFKVLYAGMTKGLSALGVELLAGADRLGLTERLLEKYRTSQPGVLQFWEHTLPGLPPRAGRRSEEMTELAETLTQLGLGAQMAHGAEATLAELAARYRADGFAEGQELAVLAEWLGREPNERGGTRK
jgi:3-hydroxyisobutyrate dehydrogenase-like beta-hydroxyacid dehydrogenase